MNPTAPFSLAERFVMILQGLYAAVAARRTLSVLVGRGTEVLPEALIVVICHRVRRVQVRVAKLLALFQAGRLPAEPVAVPRMRTRDRTAEDKARVHLPRYFGWLLVLVPCDAANYALQLRLTLAEPEMQALLAASAKARRAVKTLGRMLAIEPEVVEPRQVAEADAARKDFARGGPVIPNAPVPAGPGLAPETTCLPAGPHPFREGPPERGPPLLDTRQDAGNGGLHPPCDSWAGDQTSS